MSLPNYDIGPREEGGRHQSFGGREVLEHLRRRGLTFPILVVTQFTTFGEAGDAKSLEQLEREILADYGSSVRGVVHFRQGDAKWRDALRVFLAEGDA